MKMKMKNSSYSYGINRPRARHGHNCPKYKKCRRIMMFTCIKQYPKHILSSIHEKVKQRCG